MLYINSKKVFLCREVKNMNEEENKEKMQILYSDIQNVGKLELLKKKAFNYYEYNEYLKKVCEYNIRSILEKYYNEKELTSDEEESIRKYLFFSSNFYNGNPEGPSLNELRLQCYFGSGDFDYKELELIYKINEQAKRNGKKR